MTFEKKQIYRYTKKAVKRVIPLALAIYFIPKITALFFLIGLIDVTRNRPITLSLLDRYFFGNGVLTWLIAPFNLLIDLVSLPFRNRGIYTLDALPVDYQNEIKEVINQLEEKPELLSELTEYAKTEDRTMIFFKWYGKNLASPIDMPALQTNFRYIKSIGISVFNSKRSTGYHFGPFRTTIRVLYNLNKIDSEDVFVEVGNVLNRWKHQPLFIFDDTLLHRSVNDSDQLRFCMFVDILRPSMVPGLLSAIISLTRMVFQPINSMFYKKWTFLR